MADVYVSSVIEAPADAVWRVIRDFNALPDWHPLIASSRIEDGRAGDQIGCVRAFVLADGARLREQLLGLSDYDYSCTYSILESEMGVSNYIATLKLTPITDGNRTFAEWSASFDCPPESEAELAGTIGEGVFAGGFKALNERLGTSA